MRDECAARGFIYSARTLEEYSLAVLCKIMEVTMSLLQGKTALIFGVANDHSIAWGIAKTFHENGAHIGISYAAGALEKRVRPLADSLGCSFVEPCDVSRDEEIERVAQRAAQEFGQIDILFNNAGIVTKGTADTTSEEVWQDTLNINVTAVWHMCKLVIPHMKKQGKGVIVNNGSDWSVVAGKNGAVL